MVTPGAADGLRWTPRRAQGPAATVTRRGGAVSELRRTSRRTPQQEAPAACAKQASTCDNLWPTVPNLNLEGGEEGRTRPQKRKGGRGRPWTRGSLETELETALVCDLLQPVDTFHMLVDASHLQELQLLRGPRPAQRLRQRRHRGVHVGADDQRRQPGQARGGERGGEALQPRVAHAGLVEIQGLE